VAQASTSLRLQWLSEVLQGSRLPPQPAPTSPTHRLADFAAVHTKFRFSQHRHRVRRTAPFNPLQPSQLSPFPANPRSTSRTFCGGLLRSVLPHLQFPLFHSHFFSVAFQSVDPCLCLPPAIKRELDSAGEHTGRAYGPFFLPPVTGEPLGNSKLAKAA